MRASQRLNSRFFLISTSIRFRLLLFDPKMPIKDLISQPCGYFFFTCRNFYRCFQVAGLSQQGCSLFSPAYFLCAGAPQPSAALTCPGVRMVNDPVFRPVWRFKKTVVTWSEGSVFRLLLKRRPIRFYPVGRPQRVAVLFQTQHTQGIIVGCTPARRVEQEYIPPLVLQYFRTFIDVWIADFLPRVFRA